MNFAALLPRRINHSNICPILESDGSKCGINAKNQIKIVESTGRTLYSCVCDQHLTLKEAKELGVKRKRK